MTPDEPTTVFVRNGWAGTGCPPAAFDFDDDADALADDGGFAFEFGLDGGAAIVDLEGADRLGW
ncbi:MAG TPA: hypothetical protein VFE19_09255 [Jatrophihabitantaceae bacterium]|nr:hypothetical protein [Jatrophihabitantaceae bacterium]